MSRQRIDTPIHVGTNDIYMDILYNIAERYPRNMIEELAQMLHVLRSFGTYRRYNTHMNLIEQYSVVPPAQVEELLNDVQSVIQAMQVAYENGEYNFDTFALTVHDLERRYLVVLANLGIDPLISYDIFN